MKRKIITFLILLICLASCDKHTYIDLGLPSGTLWATCNIGAHSPSDYGDYYAWGENKVKSKYTWSTYKFVNTKAEVSYDFLVKIVFGRLSTKTAKTVIKLLDPTTIQFIYRHPDFAILYPNTKKDTDVIGQIQLN